MIKRILVCLGFIFCAVNAHAQKYLLSYDDFKYVLQNNINHTDTFLIAKGYTLDKVKKLKHNYSFKTRDCSLTGVEVILEGRKVTVTIETTDLQQYNIIKESITQFGYSVSNAGDVQVYHVKDLGDIYVMIREVEPYSPINKDYSIAIRGDKNITILN